MKPVFIAMMALFFWGVASVSAAFDTPRHFYIMNIPVCLGISIGFWIIGLKVLSLLGLIATGVMVGWFNNLRLNNNENTVTP